MQRTSDGAYFRFDTGGGIALNKATALTGPWISQGYVLTDGSKIYVMGNNGSDLWAPDVHKLGDLYYMYYAVSTFGSQTSAIGVATSSTMEAGSWTDHGSISVSSSLGNNFNAIDPNLIVAGSSYYMNFGSFFGDIYQIPMSNPLASNSSTMSGIAYNASDTHNEEGSYMFSYSRTGYFYLLISSGVCCNEPLAGTEYRIIMCRSRSATGSFIDKNGMACTDGGGSTLLSSHSTVFGPGGQGVFTDSKHGLVLYYHYANLSIGRADSQYQFGWNVIKWTDGWPVV